MDELARITLEQLERRREDSARAMWLAPGLTMAGQAFLLQILSENSLNNEARFAVLLAGIAATVAALWSLLRAHAREVQFSEEINKYTTRHDLGPIRPYEFAEPETLDEDASWDRKADRWVVLFASEHEWLRAYALWALALALFIAADIAVYCSAS